MASKVLSQLRKKYRVWDKADRDVEDSQLKKDRTGGQHSSLNSILGTLKVIRTDRRVEVVTAMENLSKIPCLTIKTVADASMFAKLEKDGIRYAGIIEIGNATEEVRQEMTKVLRPLGNFRANN